MVAVLVELADVHDIQYLASRLFKAKSSELADLSPMQLVRGDQKVFTYQTDLLHNGPVAFAVVETNSDEVVLARIAELLRALSEDEEAKGMSASFLVVVNIIKLQSTVLMRGPNERT